MSSAAYAPFFRSRVIGRASSPPTWACYEQIPCDDDGSDSEDESCSEDGEDYDRAANESDPEHDHSEKQADSQNEMHLMDMDEDRGDEGINEKVADTPKDVKGKQRAIEPEPESRKRHRKKSSSQVFTLRPILTIQKSQGFVWNQDLFVPPYIKDRYIASTSPPNASGFVSGLNSANSSMTDYEIEVVEIRVQEGDLDSIIP